MVTNEQAKNRSWIWSVLNREDYAQAEDFDVHRLPKDLFGDIVDYITNVSGYDCDVISEALMEAFDDDSYEEAYESVLTIALEKDY